LDVTETVRGNEVLGPTPLWQFSDARMGASVSRPAVVRTRVGGQEIWLAVFASGRGAAGQGALVYAVDLSTGRPLWTFDMGDASASIEGEVIAAETAAEPGTSVDGFADRLFFAD